MLSAPVCETQGIELLRGDPAAAARRRATGWAPRPLVDRAQQAERHCRSPPARSAKAQGRRRGAGCGHEPRRRTPCRCSASACSRSSSTPARSPVPTSGDAHVHQLRVDLRRLRSALALFGADDGSMPDAGAAALFRALGAARIAGPSRAAAGRADRRGDTCGGSGARAAARSAGGEDRRRPCDHCRPGLVAGRLQASAVVAADEAGAVEPLKARSPPGIASCAAARRFAELDEARHRLRKRVKRLRYALEFTRACSRRRSWRGS